jgi:hypothetical protein
MTRSIFCDQRRGIGEIFQLFAEMNNVAPSLQNDCVRGANLALQADERRVDPLQRR